MELDWTVTPVGPVTLVAVTVASDAPADRRVDLTNRLDGPVLPPRREGVPEPGWDRDGVTVRVPAGDRVAVGYACPAPPTRPPVELAACDEADGGADAARHVEGDADTARHVEGDADTARHADGDAVDPAAVVRDLGPARPPRDAVPARASPAVTGGPGNEGDDSGGPGGGEAGDGVNEGEGDDAGVTESDDADETESDDAGDPPVPPAVADWLSAVESRLDRAERLDGASVEAATAVLADGGDVAETAALADDVDADAEALRAVADRAAALADRAEAVDVPADALRRLA